MVNNEYLYDESYFRERLNTNLFDDRKLSYQVIENGYVAPADKKVYGRGGVFTSDKEYLPDTGFMRTTQWLEKEEVIADNIIDETVVYVGNISPVWGHTTTDCLKFMWFLLSEDFKEKYSNCKLMYVTQSHGLPKHFVDLLTVIGITGLKFVQITKLEQYKQVIVPEPCFYHSVGGAHFTPEFVQLIDNIHKYQKEHFKPQPECEKLYLTYSQYNPDKVSMGEKKLEKFFTSQGFKVIAPEKYTVFEQMNMYANCKHFATTMGSCAHNMMFLPENARAVIIPRTYHMPAHHVALCQALKLNIYHVDSSLSILTYRKTMVHGPFFFYVSEEMMDYFGLKDKCDDKFWKEQLGDIKKYLRKYNGRCFHLAEYIYSPEYYAKKFAYCIDKYRHACKFDMWWARTMYPYPFWGYIKGFLFPIYRANQKNALLRALRNIVSKRVAD